MHLASFLRRPSLGYGLAFILALGIGLYFRLYPLREFTRPEARERASILVLHQIKQNLLEQVRKNQPQLDAAAAQIVARRLFDDYLHKEGDTVREAIEQAGRRLDDHLTEGRQAPYLLASDSYYYYAQTQQIAENGWTAFRVEGSKYFNPLMAAPHGFWEPFNAHPYVGFLVYRTIKLFVPAVDMMTAVSFTPLVVTGLVLLAFLALLRSLNIPPMIAFISAVYLLLAPIFVKRSMFAWYDNDPYSILFPLLVLHYLFRAFRETATNYRIYAACLAALFLALYAYFWHGWVFLLSVVVGSLLAIAFYHLTFTRERQALRQDLLVLAAVGLANFLAVAALFGPREFFTLFAEGADALRDFLSPQLSSWPDLYITVSELHQAGWRFVIEQLGGVFFVAVALAGFVHALIVSKEKHVGIILGCYGLLSFAIALGAQRFAILPVVPFSVAFAVGLSAITAYLERKGRDLHRFTPLVVRLAALVTLLFPVLWINRSLPILLNPIFNQTWEKVLVKLREETPPKSIVNTWWPPGHFIKAIARRSVTFDGATISVPQAYWLSRFFLEDDERRALAILRMLNRSGNKAVETLQEKGLDVPTSVLAVSDLLRRPRDEARTILLGTFKDLNFTRKMLRMTHGRKLPPSYILIYNEFVENNLQLKFIGNYNFREIEQINDDPGRLRALPPRRSPEFIEFLWKLAGGPHRYSGVLPFISGKEGIMYFQENVVLDTNTMVAHVDSEKYGKGVPRSIFFLKDGRVFEKNLPGASLSFSMLLYARGGTPAAVLLDRDLARSMLVHLYFFEGAGLEFIKPFAHERDLTGRTDIYVFEVDWKGFVESFQEAPLR